MAGLFDRLQEDLEQRDKMAGMSPADLLMLPDDERRIVQALARRGDLSLDELVAHLDSDVDAVRATLAVLREKGFARELDIKGRTIWRTYFARRKPSSALNSIWANLAEKTDVSAEADASGDASVSDGADAHRDEGGSRPTNDPTTGGNDG